MSDATPDLSRFGLDTDPARSEAARSRRRRRLVRLEIPRLRLFGLALLSLGAFLHERYLRDQFSWDNWIAITAILVGYGAVAWVTLVWVSDRARRIDLTAAFLVLDLPVWAIVIYRTGATESLLFFVLLARSADLVATSARRALVFAHLVPLTYATLVGWVALVDRAPVDWPAETTKILFLYIMSLYLASVARVVERRTGQRAAALELATGLLGRMRRQSADLTVAKLEAEAALDRQAGLARERAELHERTRRQQQQLQRIFDSTSDALVLVGTEGRVESANATAGRLLGLDPAAVAGTPVVDAIGDTLREPGDDRPWRRALNALVASPDRMAQGDLVHISTGRVLHWAAAPARDSAGVTMGLTLTFQDVTANWELIEELGHKSAELADANRRMEEAHRAKEEFLANVSHEIRTPLSAIVGMSQLAVDAGTETERRYYLEKLERSAEVLLTLINDILDFSRIEAGHFSLAPAPFAVAPLVESALDTVRLEAGRKGLALHADVAPDVPPTLVGDGARLRQVLVNLVSNAVKFTDQGEVAVSVALDSRDADAVVLHAAVRDTGIGIPADKQQTVFEAFVQADGSTTRRFGGTGLGLSIASRLAGLMGGELGLESEVGRGSTFHFRVRLGLPAEAGTDAGAGPPAPRPEPAVAGLVLIADDNAIQRELVMHLLARAGYRVVAVASGGAALEELRHAQVDLVLLDLQMPGMDGFQTAAAIRRLEAGGERRVPIVAITASASASDRERCLQVGIDDYLSKPVGKEQLLGMVAETIARHPADARPLWQLEDREAFLTGLGHDLDLARRLVQLFLGQAPDLLAEIERRVHGDDAKAIHRAAHALKGAMGSFPLVAAQNLVTRLELAALNGNLDTARRLFPPLAREMERVTRELEGLV